MKTTTVPDELNISKGLLFKNSPVNRGAPNFMNNDLLNDLHKMTKPSKRKSKTGRSDKDRTNTISNGKLEKIDS